MYTSALGKDTSRHRPPAGGNGTARYEIDEFLRGTIICRKNEPVALRTNDARRIRFAQPRCRGNQRIEHLLQIERRATDDLEHVGGGGLLLEGYGEVVGALAQLVKQPRVLDGDDGLGGKVLHQFDLLVRERSHFCAIDKKGAD